MNEKKREEKLDIKLKALADNLDLRTEKNINESKLKKICKYVQLNEVKTLLLSQASFVNMRSDYILLKIVSAMEHKRSIEVFGYSGLKLSSINMNAAGFTRYLQHSDCRIRVLDLPSLELNNDEADFYKKWIGVLKNCASLRSLHIENLIIEPSESKSLSEKLYQFMGYEVSREKKIPYAFFNALENWFAGKDCQLTELSLSDNCIVYNEENIFYKVLNAIFLKNTSIVVLNLNNNQIKLNELMNLINSNRTLKELYLKNNSIEEADICFLLSTLDRKKSRLKRIVIDEEESSSYFTSFAINTSKPSNEMPTKLALHLKNYKDALHYHTKEFKEEPDWLEVLGDIRFGLKQFDLAIDAYDHQLTFECDHTPVLMKKAKAFYEQGVYELGQDILKCFNNIDLGNQKLLFTQLHLAHCGGQLNLEEVFKIKMDSNERFHLFQIYLLFLNKQFIEGLQVVNETFPRSNKLILKRNLLMAYLLCCSPEDSSNYNRAKGFYNGAINLSSKKITNKAKLGLALFDFMNRKKEAHDVGVSKGKRKEKGKEKEKEIDEIGESSYVSALIKKAAALSPTNACYLLLDHSIILMANGFFNEAQFFLEKTNSILPHFIPAEEKRQQFKTEYTVSLKNYVLSTYAYEPQEQEKNLIEWIGVDLDLNKFHLIYPYISEEFIYFLFMVSLHNNAGFQSIFRWLSFAGHEQKTSLLEELNQFDGMQYQSDKLRKYINRAIEKKIEDHFFHAFSEKEDSCDIDRDKQLCMNLLKQFDLAINKMLEKWIKMVPPFTNLRVTPSNLGERINLLMSNRYHRFMMLPDEIVAHIFSNFCFLDFTKLIDNFADQNLKILFQLSRVDKRFRALVQSSKVDIRYRDISLFSPPIRIKLEFADPLCIIPELIKIDRIRKTISYRTHQEEKDHRKKLESCLGYTVLSSTAVGFLTGWGLFTWLFASQMEIPDLEIDLAWKILIALIPGFVGGFIPAIIFCIAACLMFAICEDCCHLDKRSEKEKKLEDIINSKISKYKQKCIEEEKAIERARTLYPSQTYFNQITLFRTVPSANSRHVKLEEDTASDESEYDEENLTYVPMQRLRKGNSNTW